MKKQMSGMILTDEEKQLILDKRAKEEAERAKKSAQLKHDLYFASSRTYNSDISHLFDQFVSKKEVDAAIKDLRNSFELSVPKNTNFICFIEDGDELWYDDENIGIEGMDSDWAEENLINVKNI